jgi:hypothetical protein
MNLANKEAEARMTEALKDFGIIIGKNRKEVEVSTLIFFDNRSRKR